MSAYMFVFQHVDRIDHEKSITLYLITQEILNIRSVDVSYTVNHKINVYTHGPSLRNRNPFIFAGKQTFCKIDLLLQIPISPSSPPTKSSFS